MATLLIMGGTTGARQEQEEEDGTDGALEPTATHTAFEKRVSELKWMESLSLRAAAEQMGGDCLTSGTPAGFAGVADRLGDELSLEGPVSAERVAGLFRLWLSSAERLAAPLCPGQAA
ncbi:hypothetical protein ACSSS7_006758 [Eimeria intestinalis]